MKKSGGCARESNVSQNLDVFSQNKPSLKQGLLIIAILLLTVFLFDHFSKESITSAALSNELTGATGITGASHVVISTETGLDKFKIQLHNFFEMYLNSERTQQDKEKLVADTENALSVLYAES